MADMEIRQNSNIDSNTKSVDNLDSKVAGLESSLSTLSGTGMILYIPNF